MIVMSEIIGILSLFCQSFRVNLVRAGCDPSSVP
jgi:hypothetical protein